MLKKSATAVAVLALCAALLPAAFRREDVKVHKLGNGL